MSCLLVDENIGDALIDVALPAFYSGIYVIGALLYEVSSFALLLPLCIIIGIIIYHKFVYRPAKRAHDTRKSILKRRQSYGNSASIENQRRKMRNMSTENQTRNSNAVRVLTILQNGIIAGIANLSMRRFKKQIATRVAQRQKWWAMNVPASYQGAGLGQRDSKAGGRLHNDVRDNIAHFSYPNPNKIKRMMMSLRKRQSGYQSAPNLFDVSIVLKNQLNGHTTRDPVVIKPLQGGLIYRELRPVIIFDTGEALLRIRSKLSTAAIRELSDTEEKANGDQEGIVIEKGASEKVNVQYEVGVNDRRIHNEVVDELSLNLFEIPVPDLLKEFQDIFEFFYPDGITMSKVEKEEVFELFTVWIHEQEYQSKMQFDGAAYCEVQTIGFEIFYNWFFDLSQMVHDVISNRLTNYILLSSNLSDNTGSLNNSNKMKPQMKLLNLVTSQLLRDTDAKYSAAPTSPHLSEKHSRNHGYTENPLRDVTWNS